MLQLKTLAASLFILVLSACSADTQIKNKDITEVAGNDDVLNYMKTFEGRGDLSDTSQMVPAQEAVKRFTVPNDLALDLVLGEPQVTQPVFITFDPRGRMWVVQYNQYPYPEGLKVVNMDWHTRATFDKEPLPPPSNAKGADKITMFEDTDNDGTFDKSTDVITGLNLISSVAFGRGQIWVLNPPYLLAYPDTNNDGVPDGKPAVVLKGFGLEDTHAIANNLRFGPDGWLYGAQGSTCNANISSEVSKNIQFKGQAIWRYHPDTKVFEVFAEGGGNTFDVEIDTKGRLYSGDNGTSRGQYYKQGGYFVRNLGKHGEYTNPYTFGRLDNMALTGDEQRFTHAFVRYAGGSLPERYNDRMIALNPLQSYMQLTRFEPNGSTFKTIDEERLLQTEDHWFRPVDIVNGPDGNIYIADWYDSRISHIDPRDTWNKNSGRIYRLRSREKPGAKTIKNLWSLPDAELLELLNDKNNWYRQTALQVLADRKNASLVPQLKTILQGDDGDKALEALWAINLAGGFNDEVSQMALQHSDPYVRMWAVRLIGDAKQTSTLQKQELLKIALSEKHAEVRSQLAASAKRLPGSTAIAIINNLLQQDDSKDPDIPLQIWWAVEAKCETDTDSLLAIFRAKKVWTNPVVSKTILSRLTQRYILSGSEQNVAAVAKLFKLAPSEEYAGMLFTGLQEGLRGRDIAELSPVLVAALAPYKKLFGEQTLAIELRTGKKEAVEKALKIIEDNKSPLPELLTYIRIFGETTQPEALPVLLDIVGWGPLSGRLKQGTLLALQNYSSNDVGERVVRIYPDGLRTDYDVRESALALLSSRPAWSKQLLNAITKTHAIEKSDVPEHTVRQMKMLGDKEITAACEKLWPELRLSTAEERNKTVDRVNSLVKSAAGDAKAGHPLFIAKCGTCHKLFNEGRNIAPDLSGYDRKNVADLLTNIVDPSAYIREGYGTWHLTTTDGRTVIGTMRARNDQSVTIQPFTGEAVVVAAGKVKNLEAMEVSMMPERLLDGISDREVRDLFAYIMK